MFSPPGDDDVLGAVLDLDIAVGVAHPQIAGVEPAALEGRVGRRGILQITHHDGVAAQEDLAHGLAVPGGLRQRRRVGDHDALQGQIGHSLARRQPRPLLQAQAVPFVMPGADQARAIAFGQPIGMGDAETVAFHGGDDGAGRRRAAGRDRDALVENLLGGIGGVRQHVQHDRRAAEMGHALALDRGIDQGRIHPAQADMGARHGGDRPGEAPAVAMEHRQRPQIGGLAREPGGHRHAQRVQIGAAMVADHALGIAGGAGGIAEADGGPFIGQRLGAKRGIARGDEGLVVHLAQPPSRTPAEGIVDVDHQ